MSWLNCSSSKSKSQSSTVVGIVVTQIQHAVGWKQGIIRKRTVKYKKSARALGTLIYGTWQNE